MGWGSAFAGAYRSASAAGKALADEALSSAAAAATAVGRQAAKAAQATQDAAVAAAQAAARATKATATATARAATSAAHATAQAATAVARGAVNSAGFGARAVGGLGTAAAGMAADAVTAPYRAARALLAPAAPPASTLVCACPETWPAKKARLEKRQQLILDGRRSPAPRTRAAAERLAANNDAVELARLSENSYDQYAPEKTDKTAPLGWKVFSAAELPPGIEPDLLADSRAVIYQTEDDWPGGKKTVLAFRGTADLEDGIVDHDQAMGLDTAQYRSAVELGKDVKRSLGADVLVTGHSLGGGKAQAAGLAGGLKGTMFNAAGPHANVTGGLAAQPGQFIQYRTAGDPLTGVQNSAAIQTALVGVVGPLGVLGGGLAKAGDGLAKLLGFQGLSPTTADYADKAFKALPRAARNIVESGDAMPPAIGPVREVQAIDAKGDEVAGVNLLGQHSITSAVNGIEQQKTEDLHTLDGK